MKRLTALLLGSVITLSCLTGCNKSAPVKNFTEPAKGDEIVTIKVKDYGTIKIRLFPELLPKACENFITHSKDGYYNELLFHRVIDNFMIQGGDPRGNGSGGESIWGGKFDGGVSESLIHVRGAVAYANSDGTSTDGSQFYIVTAGPVNEETLSKYEEDGYGPYTDEQKELYTTVGGAPWLDGKYTVFGQVIDGLDVVIDISRVTDKNSKDKPYTSIVMESVTVDTYDGSDVNWYASDFKKD